MDTTHSLPTKKYFNSNLLRSTKCLLHDVCGICRSEYDDHSHWPCQVIVPLCKHVFGKKCIDRLLRESNKCPYCRRVWYRPLITSLGPENTSEDDKDFLSSELSQRLRIDIPSMRYYLFRERAYKELAPPTNLCWIGEHLPILQKVEALIVYDEGFMDTNGCFRELELEREQIQGMIRKAQKSSIQGSYEAADSLSFSSHMLQFEEWEDERSITDAIFYASLSGPGRRLREMLGKEMQTKRTKEEAFDATVLRWLASSVSDTHSVIFLQLYLLVTWVLDSDFLVLEVS